MKDVVETPAWQQSPLMKAVRREPVKRTPIWLMRQAGRYQPEYRELRRKVGFLELCKRPDLCAQVMAQTVDQLGVDAAIVFSDLLLILEPLGLNLEFTSGDGPKLGNPIRAAADVARILELESMDRLPFVVEAVRQTRQALPGHIPLIGFAGAPFTLAAYAIEGGGSRDYRLTKTFMYSQPAAWNDLMGRLTRAISFYLAAQIAAGAQLVQMFDSWVGCLGVDDYSRYVLPFSRQVIASVSQLAPVIHFATGNPALLPLLGEAGGSVIGVDWRTRLDDAWRVIGPDKAIQGNLDPVVLLSTPQEIGRRAREVLTQAGGQPGHIFNLGHGVLPQTPVENVLALVEAVHEARG